MYASRDARGVSTAWEAHSLSVLTDGRFEMGVGTGRPGIEDQLRELGLPVVPPGQRLTRCVKIVTALRDLDGPAPCTRQWRWPYVGPKARALAAEVADTVTFVTAAELSLGLGGATGTRLSHYPRRRTRLARAR